MTTLSIIVAMANNRVIGLNNQLPWHLPADLKHFKALTLGKPIIMGRRTYESIGHALPGRCNIIITRNEGFKASDVLVVNSFDAALAAAGDVPELMMIGGESVFKQALPLVQRIYLTIIHQEFVGDTFFPPLDQTEWLEVERIEHLADEKNHYDYAFVVLERR